MRVGIDCRTILNPEKGEGAGIGHYTYQLVRHLLEVDKENTYILFFDRSAQKTRIAKFKHENVHIRFFPFVQYTRLMPTTCSHFLVSAILCREKLDIFHSPTLSLPFSYKGTSIITVHDLSVYKFPELYLRKEVLRLKKDIPSVLRQAQKIIAVSQSTAKDVSKIFNISSDKIKVIFHGIDKRFFKKSSPAQIKKVKHKYGITKDYFLFLGTLDARKNIVRIICAYERFRDKYIHILKNPIQQLVLAGAKGKNFKNIQKRISFSKYKKDIILPGYIEADDLDPLFEGADVFIFPSLYEGFGLPIIEAMANGVPVITSNVSSLPEVAKGGAILVDPHSVAEITQSLYTILTDKELHRDLCKNGKNRAREFSWEKCAQQTLKVYKEAFKH